MRERPPTLELIKVHDTVWGSGDMSELMLAAIVAQFGLFAMDDVVTAVIISGGWFAAFALLFEHTTRESYRWWQDHQEMTNHE